MLLTLKFRLRDKHATELNRQARAVNYVWNYCNDTQRKAARDHRKWLTWVDLANLTAGSSRELGLHSHTIQHICINYEKSRRQSNKAWLRFRGRKSLGWVPFNQGHVRFDGKAFVFRGVRYDPMHVRAIPDGAIIRAGSFNQDSQGRWYLNVPIEFADDHFPKCNHSSVGIDLGLKNIATLSDGNTIAAPQWYRALEQSLGVAFRANKRRRVRSISSKIANGRRDYLHKASAQIARNNDVIVIGDVSSSKLARTTMAKSVLDAGWRMFRNQILYKAIRHGGICIEADERWTTQTCSACGSLPEGRPKGIAGLGIREWTCRDCGAVHGRDVNAAKNILARGLASLAEGAPREGSSQLHGRGFKICHLPHGPKSGMF